MDQSTLFEYIIDVFTKLKIPYFFTGSIASIYYGEPRLTNDFDIIAIIKNFQIEKIVKEFPSNKFYLDKKAIKEAIEEKSQFNIIHPSSGLKLDIFKGRCLRYRKNGKG